MPSGKRSTNASSLTEPDIAFFSRSRTLPKDTKLTSSRSEGDGEDGTEGLGTCLLSSIGFSLVISVANIELLLIIRIPGMARVPVFVYAVQSEE